MYPITAAVDFDGVLHNPNDKRKGFKMGQPVVGAVDAMNELKAEGALLVIHSVWADTGQKRQAIADWCQYFNIPYDFITNEKPDCMIYIDDRGYRFKNWDDTLKFIKDTF